MKETVKRIKFLKSIVIILFSYYTDGKCTYKILGECLLIPSLPGEALRTLVDIARLAHRTMVFYLSAYQVDSLLKLANMT